MKELARLIYQGTDELTFKTVKEYSDDVTIRIPDISKATKELGFKPSKKVKDSVKVCLEKLN
jgi:nucleoside-diphosphate-sugar epimerase